MQTNPIANSIQRNDVPGAAVVQLQDGHLLESRGLEETYGKLLEIVESDARRQLVLDFSSVSSISAAGCGRLVALKRKLHARGGKLTLRNVGDRVYQAFVVTRLARHFGLRAPDSRTLTGLRGQSAAGSAVVVPPAPSR